MAEDQPELDVHGPSEAASEQEDDDEYLYPGSQYESEDEYDDDEPDDEDISQYEDDDQDVAYMCAMNASSSEDIIMEEEEAYLTEEGSDREPGPALERCPFPYEVRTVMEDCDTDDWSISFTPDEEAEWSTYKERAARVQADSAQLTRSQRKRLGTSLHMRDLHSTMQTHVGSLQTQLSAAYSDLAEERRECRRLTRMNEIRTKRIEQLFKELSKTRADLYDERASRHHMNRTHRATYGAYKHRNDTIEFLQGRIKALIDKQAIDMADKHRQIERIRQETWEAQYNVRMAGTEIAQDAESADESADMPELESASSSSEYSENNYNSSDSKLTDSADEEENQPPSVVELRMARKAQNTDPEE
ncbi:hypothetical protein PENSPDRAFT_694991 [Peniophora sp. CONT]|nr:hypothetical protein PENSPDRAFT_694991 [Peniophora sp. CONT]